MSTPISLSPERQSTKIATNTNPLAQFGLAGEGLDRLKLLAMILMLVDHINYIVLDEEYAWMGYLGRGAFPLFAIAMASNLVHQVPLEKYAGRIFAFALISQPFAMIALDDEVLCILFTLLLAAIAGDWVVNKPVWRRYALFAIGIVTVFFNYPVDYGIAGIAFPALLACAFMGDRIAWILASVFLIALNIELSDFMTVEDSSIGFLMPSTDVWLEIMSSLLIPVLIYEGFRRVRGPRFLPRYALYIFYPAHLAILAIYVIAVDEEGFLSFLSI